MTTLHFGQGIKLFKKHFGASAISALALALGIGLAAASISLSYGILARPLPFQDPAGLVWMWSSSVRRGAGTGAVSMADFLDYRKQSESFELLSAFVNWPYQITGRGEAERVVGARVTVDLPSALGVKAALGRTFQPSEAEPGNDKVAVLGDALWRRSFGGDAGIVGKSVRMGGEAYTVVGVLPAGVDFPPQCELWTPLALQPAEKASRRFRALRPVGRLKSGATLSDAQQELEMIARRLEIKHPGTNADVGVKLAPLQEILGGGLRRNLLGLVAAALVLLAFSWANFASLLSMRARGDAAALDPAPARAGINAWVMAVSIAGAAGGSLITAICLLFLRRLGPERVIRLSDVRFDGITMGFVGLAAAIGYLITSVSSSRAARAGVGAGYFIKRSLLAGVQIAVAFAAIGAAAFTAWGFARYAATDPGFKAENLTAMQVNTPPAKYADAPRRLAVMETLLQKIRRIPGVEIVAGTTELALSGQSSDALFLIEGRSPVAPGGRPSSVGLRVVTPDYFKAMSIPLLTGRLFEPGDAGKPNFIVINDVLLREYFFLDEPIGKQLTIDLGEKWTGEIIGVTGSVRHVNVGLPPTSELYLSNFQRPSGGLNLIVKTRPGTDAGALKAAITAQVKSVDEEIPVSQFRAMDKVIADSVAQPRLFATIVEIAATAALAMSLIALFGLAGSIAADGSHRARRTVRGVLLRATIPVVAGLAVGFGLWSWLVGFLPTVGASADKWESGSALLALAVMTVLGAAALVFGARAGAGVPRKS